MVNIRNNVHYILDVISFDRCKFKEGRWLASVKRKCLGAAWQFPVTLILSFLQNPTSLMRTNISGFFLSFSHYIHILGRCLKVVEASADRIFYVTSYNHRAHTRINCHNTYVYSLTLYNTWKGVTSSFQHWSYIGPFRC